MDWHSRYIQQARWTADLRGYLLKSAGYNTTSEVIEVGCGTGAILADLSPASGIHGIDINLSYLETARKNIPNIHFVNADAHDLPFASATFDIAFCHFLLMWLNSPINAIKEMKRITRHGGYVIIMAEPNYYQRKDKPFSLRRLGTLQTKSLKKQGADPGIGIKIVDLFRQAGITICEAGIIQHSKTTLASEADRSLEWSVMEADLSQIIDDQEIERLRVLENDARIRGDRQLYVPTYFAYGLV